MSFVSLHDGRPRPWLRFVLAVLVVVFVQTAAELAGAVIHHATGIDAEAVTWPLVLAGLLLGFTFLLTVADHTESNPIAAQGLSFEVPALHQWVVGALLGLAGVLLGVAAIAFGGGVSFEWKSSGMGAVLLVSWTLLVAALAEEVAFRGYPFQRLSESIGPWPAVAVMSLFFGAVHLGNPAANPISFLNTVLYGLPLSLAYLRTGQLWFPWGLHFSWNFVLGVVFGLPVSGLNFASPVEAQASGPTWLTGGAYGIEGSVTGTVLILFETAGVWWLTRGTRSAEKMENVAHEPVPGIQP